MTLTQSHHLLMGVSASVMQLRSFRKAYERTIAFDFNPMDFLGLDENKYSEIFAYFLDPTERHGQRDVYLKCFLKEIAEIAPLTKELDTSPGCVNVECEKATDEKRRYDVRIVFKKPQGFAIVIENKLWAIDQDRQLDDYRKDLQKHFPGRHHLVYLTPDGRKPDVSSKATGYQAVKTVPNETFQLLSYREHMSRIVQDWISVTEADNVRFFLKGLGRKIGQLSGEGSGMDENGVVVKQILGTANGIEAAFSIALAIDTLKDDLAAKAQQTLTSIAHELRLNFRSGGKPGKQTFSWNFLDADWQHFNVTFQFGSAGYQGLVAGITVVADGKYRKTTDDQIILDSLPKDYQVENGWWAALQHAPEDLHNWSGNASVWKMVEQAKPDSRLYEWIRDIITELRPVVNELEKLRATSGKSSKGS